MASYLKYFTTSKPPIELNEYEAVPMVPPRHDAAGNPSSSSDELAHAHTNGNAAHADLGHDAEALRVGGKRPRLSRTAIRRAVLLTISLVGIGWFAVLLFTRHTWGLPPCGKVIVQQFENSAGFGSEFGIFLRVSSIAGFLGGAVIANSSNWVYGDMHDFFLPRDPRSYTCTLPDDLAPLAFEGKQPTKPIKFVELYGGTGWEHASRVDYRRGNLLFYIDNLVRDATVDLKLTKGLLEKEKWYQIDAGRMTVPYGESVPRELYKTFVGQVEVMNSIWRPAPKMQAQIDRLSDRVGLPAKDWSSTKNRQPVVALQIRMGDKVEEQGDLLRAGTHMVYDDMHHYYDAARIALMRLYDCQVTPSPHCFTKPAELKKEDKHKIRPGEPRPKLVVMTAEPGVLDKMREFDRDAAGFYPDEKGGVFEIVQSPSLELTEKEEQEYLKAFGHALPGEIVVYPAATGRNDSSTTHRQREKRWSFNDLHKAGRGVQLALGRQLVAELTVYSQRADAFVVSGNSNMGRLAQLLGGVEGSLGYGVDVKKNSPHQDALRTIGGRVRSIDVPWFPTTWRAYIFP